MDRIVEQKGKKAKRTGGEEESRKITPVKWPFGSCDPVKWFLTAVVFTDAFESIAKCQLGLGPGDFYEHSC